MTKHHVVAETDVDVGEVEDTIDAGLFEEPAGYFQPEKPFTHESFTLDDGWQLELRLVGFNPLWAHHIWQGALLLAEHLQRDVAVSIKNKRVLELGAGAGLPSLVAATLGADVVVVTDYPDAELVENMAFNIDRNKHLWTAHVEAQGHCWGADVSPLLAVNSTDGPFDFVFLADLLFNHSQHEGLANTVRRTLKRHADARAFVFFTPYRPWLLEKDLDFFRVVCGNGEGGQIASRQILEVVRDNVMFEGDPGDELLRRTVWGHELYWVDLQPR